MSNDRGSPFGSVAAAPDTGPRLAPTIRSCRKTVLVFFFLFIFFLIERMQPFDSIVTLVAPCLVACFLFVFAQDIIKPLID